MARLFISALAALFVIGSCRIVVNKPSKAEVKSSAKAAKTTSKVSKKKEPIQVLKKVTKKVKKESHKFSATLETKDVRALWEGRDFPDAKLPLKDLTVVETPKAPAKRNVHIFGLQNSGTTLLRSLMYTNFGHRLNYFDSEVTGTDIAGRKPGLWTYSSFKELHREERDAVQELSNAEVYAISVVRNPYDWLLTMRTGPALHCLSECTSGEDWLTKKCTHLSPGGPDSVITKKEYQSLEGLWNHWNEGYGKASTFGFPKSLVITYEDLVTNPEEILDQVAEFLEVKKTVKEWTVPFDDGEEAEAARDEMMDRVNSKTFMNMFIQKEKQQACVHLDPDVVQLLGYRAFDCTVFSSGGNTMQQRSKTADLAPKGKGEMQDAPPGKGAPPAAKGDQPPPPPAIGAPPAAFFHRR